MSAKNGYCPYDGRRATWPSDDPAFCTKNCAANLAWVNWAASGGDGTSHCETCGHEAEEGDCENPKCEVAHYDADESGW